MLVPLPFAPRFAPPPPEHRALCDAAMARAHALGNPDSPDRIAGLATTEPTVAWTTARAARDLVPASANRFCEWGFGVGLVACLAARAGWQVSGLELEPVLVAEAQALAVAHGIKVDLVQGSYKPADFLADVQRPPPRAFGADVTFAYAWPAEVAPLCRMFGGFAATGAVLILYRGGTDLTAWRQVAGEPSAASSAARPER